VRQIAASLGLPHSTVTDYLRRFHQKGLPWPLPGDPGEVALIGGVGPSGERCSRNAAAKRRTLASRARRP